MNVEIHSCYFCGNAKLKVESKHNGKWANTGTHSASVRCPKCHARGPTASCKVEKARYRADEVTIQKAIELWNAIGSINLNTGFNGCDTCKHVAFRYPYASMYPCVNCIHGGNKDYYNVELKEV